MARRKRIWIIVVIFIIIFGVGLLLPSFNQESIYPNDLKLTREQFPLIYDFELNPGFNQITLNEGVNLDNVYKIEIISRGCWNDQGQNTNSETINFNEKKIDYSFISCEFLFYSDQGDESEYQHYETREKNVAEILTTRNLNINVNTNPDLQVIQRTLKIWEMTDCTRSSQCGEIRVNDKILQPFCDLNYHKCSLDAIPISNPGTTPTNITEGKDEGNTLVYILIWLAIALVIASLVYYFIFRRKK